MKKEAEMSESERQTEIAKIKSDVDSKLVGMDEETRNEKEPELGDRVQKMKDEVQDERKGQKDSIAREGDKEGIKKRVDLKNEKKDVKEGVVQSKVDAKLGEKLKKLEKSSKNVEKGEEGKKEKKEKAEKKASSHSGHPEGKKNEAKEKTKEKKEKTKEEKEKEEKKDKKDKKSKNSSERIHKKLEKINAKIGRILVKKEEYEVRLKEALERERQESEMAEGFELSTTATRKSAHDSNSPGLRSEESIVTDQLRLVHDASRKKSNDMLAEEGLSGSLSRTASLVEATPTEVMDEVASQKAMVKKLAKLEVRDVSEVNPSLPIENPEVFMTGKGKVLKATLQKDDSKDVGTT